MADRYTYLSLLGPAIGLAWAGQYTRSHTVCTLLGLLVLGLIGWKSHTQVQVWQNTETLFTHALQVNPRSALAHNNMGFTFAAQGRLEEAIAHYQQALQVRQILPTPTTTLDSPWLIRASWTQPLQRIPRRYVSGQIM